MKSKIGPGIPFLFFAVEPIGLVDMLLIGAVLLMLIMLSVVVLFAFRELSIRRQTRMHLFGNPMQAVQTSDDSLQPAYSLDDIRKEMIGRLEVMQSQIEENADFIKGIGYATIISTVVLLFIVIRVF